MKNGFVIYQDYKEILSILTDEELGKLFRSLFDYEKDGTIPKFNRTLMVAFNFIKGNLDRDKDKYNEKCKKNKKNGEQGGRPKNRTVILETDTKSEKPKKPDIDIDIDTDIDTDTDTDIDTTKERKESGSCSIYEFYEQELGRTIAPSEFEQIDKWISDYGLDKTKLAIVEAISKGKRNASYVNGILANWKDLSIQEIKEQKSKSNNKYPDPEWMNKTITAEQASSEEQKELEKVLGEINL